MDSTMRGVRGMRKVVHLEELFPKFVKNLDAAEIDAVIERIGDPNDRVTEFLLNTCIKRKMTLAQVI